MNTFSQSLQTLLGIGTQPGELTFLQVSLRGVIVFIATLIMVRLGSKRSLAEKTAFDAVFIVIIGSMLARAINGSEAFFPTLGTGFVLVFLHRLFGFAAYYSHVFGILVKGKPVVLVQDGRCRLRSGLDGLRGGLGAVWRRGRVDWSRQGVGTIAPWISADFARQHDMRGRALAQAKSFFHAAPDQNK